MSLGLRLDHVFCFSDPRFPEMPVMESLGFNVEPQREHRGQGTGNRCAIFEENYLEFITLTSEADSRNNPLKLYRRAQWKKMGFSPFGVALRGTVPEKDRAHFWEYRPPYAPGNVILMLKACEEKPELPLIFVMSPKEGMTVEQMVPKKWASIEPRFLVHKSGAKRIESVLIQGPGITWPLSIDVPGVMFESGDRFQMRVQVGPSTQQRVQLNELLELGF